jgi:hypothetical protein
MLSTTAALFDHAGPFVSVYLDSSSDQARPKERIDLRWKNARKGLEEAGADAATLEAVEREVTGNHAGGSTLAVFAADGEVLLSRHLTDPPAEDRWRFGPFPWVGPMAEAEQSLIPHVVVLSDRVGADVYGITTAGDTVSDEVDGDTEHIHRGHPGGWSQRRFQQRAENTWDANARLAAEKVVEVVEQTAAKAVLIGGDVRSVGFLRDALPAHVAELVRPLEGGQRNAGASIDEAAEEITRQIDTVVAEQTTRLLQEFREEKGQRDRAADGPERVVEALQAAIVDTLLVHDDPDDDRTAWFGPEPGHLALERDDLVSGMGVEEPRQGRLVDGCIRAAVATGADVRIVPGAVVTDGLGAVLRRTDIELDALGS